MAESTRIGRNISSSFSLDQTVGVNEYLRLLNPSDISEYNKDRNAGYINGAVLFTATERTLSGLMGMLFRSQPKQPELPAAIKYILENVDGSGNTIDQQAQSVGDSVTSIGRDGLLVDMPRNDDGLPKTMADVDNGFRATIQEYKAHSIIDWHETTEGGIRALDLVVLRETFFELDDKDELSIRRLKKTRYRIYRLREDGVTVSIFVDGKDEAPEEFEIFETKGVRLKVIPFVFVGSKNNTPDIDRLPLEGLANVNLGHYQEQANLAVGSFQFGSAQPYIADSDFQNASRADENKGQDFKMGDGFIAILGTSGKLDFAVPPANTMSGEIKKDYAAQMVSLGAQLISDGGQAETAEAARLKHASDVSVLDLVSRNVSDAYNQCLGWVAMFMGATIPDDQKYMLNQDFFESSLTPEQLGALVAAWQGGAISKDVLDTNLQSGKVIAEDVDLELMNGAIESEPGLDLDAQSS